MIARVPSSDDACKPCPGKGGNFGFVTADFSCILSGLVDGAESIEMDGSLESATGLESISIRSCPSAVGVGGSTKCIGTDNGET